MLPARRLAARASRGGRVGRLRQAVQEIAARSPAAVGACPEKISVRRDAALAVERRVRGLVDGDHAAVERDSAEQTARARIRIDFGIEVHVGGRGALPADGPVATDASAPSVSLPPAMPSTPVLVVNTRMMSEDCAPAWKPQLPPVSETNTGLLHGEVEFVAHHQHAVAVAAAENESDLGDVGNHGDSVGAGEQRIRASADPAWLAPLPAPPSPSAAGLPRARRHAATLTIAGARATRCEQHRCELILRY